MEVELHADVGTRLKRDVRLLKVYAGVSTLLLLVLLLAAAIPQPVRPKFEGIDVERINVVERDGKLRLVISNKERFPAPVIDGKTAERQGGKHPGLVFYNDEGDECGGLVFDSSQEGGKYEAGAALLFDQYNQDQTVGLMYNDDNGRRHVGFQVWDRPDTPLSQFIERLETIQRMPEGAEKKEAMKQLEDAAKRGEFGASRVFVGKNPQKEALVELSDPKGRPRLRLSVDVSGAPKIELMDESGKVIQRLPPQQ